MYARRSFLIWSIEMAGNTVNLRGSLKDEYNQYGGNNKLAIVEQLLARVSASQMAFNARWRSSLLFFMLYFRLSRSTERIRV